jgi:hypothetical protein
MTQVQALAEINNIVQLDGKMSRVVYVGYPGSVEHMNIAGYGADPDECVYTCMRDKYEQLCTFPKNHDIIQQWNFTSMKKRENAANVIQRMWKKL